MKFKALRMALVAGFLMTSSVVVAVDAIEHNLLGETSVNSKDWAGPGRTNG